VTFAAITLCIASQGVFIIVVYFVIDSVQKFLDTSSYLNRLGRPIGLCWNALNVSNLQVAGLYDYKRISWSISQCLYCTRHWC